MAKRANPPLVGAFVIGAAVLILVAVSLLGSGHFFRRRHRFVLYFRSNVNGLRADAAVKFHGVEIGSVYRILLSLTQFQHPVSANAPAVMRVPVLVEVDEKRIISRGGAALDLNDPATLHRLIAAGLRGQLALESLLTGRLYVDLDMHPGTPVDLVLPPNSSFQEIPTLPTELEQVQQNLSKLVAKLSQIDFPRTIDSVVRMTDAIRTLAESPRLGIALDRLQAATHSLDAAAQSARLMTDTIRTEIVPLSHSLQGASNNTAETMRQARAAMVSARSAFEQAQAAFVQAKAVLDPASPITYQLSKTLEELSEAARSTRELADFLRRNPSALIRGRAISQDRQ